MTSSGHVAKVQHMALEVPRPTAPRRWQDVRVDRGISLRILGELVGKTHSTMLAYSIGKRVPPQEVIWKLSKVLGEDVQ